MALDYLYVYICILNNIADIAIIQSSENSDGYAFKPILKLKWTEYATFTLAFVPNSLHIKMPNDS